jgi:ectoine hydroxylase-related dioxygenase (phytanoyl-CoA dioxygenase family)
MMGLQHFTRDSSPSDIAEAIRRDGGAIIDRLLDGDLVDRVLSETAPFLDATPGGGDEFSGRLTRRTGSLIARSPSFRELAAHPSVLGVCDEILGPNASTYQLHLTQIIDIGPGESAQPLHRDHWAWDFFAFPAGFEVEISTIWAMQDFTEENGATRVVPGSHVWTDDRKPTQADTVPAEMERGSVLLYTGSLFHGGGANHSDRRRTAVNIDYCLGWLRQEENQYLSCPPEVARDLPIELARLIGYRRGSFALGYFGDTQDPIEAVHPGAGSGGLVDADLLVTDR